MQVYSEQQIRAAVQLNETVIDVIEDAFTSLKKQKVAMPPIMRVDIPEHNGEIDVKTAYVPSYDAFAIKVSSGFFDNDKRGLPSGSGLMILISTETGIPLALLQDNGYLTDVRTAAAGAVCARYFAPQHFDQVAVIGAGTQARYQIKALAHVRRFRRVFVYSRSTERKEAFRREIESALNVEVVDARTPEEAVKECQVIITATPAKTPIVRGEWLQPGQHVTALGSDAEEKQELDASVLQKADRIICDVKSQAFRLGELHHARKKGVLQDDDRRVEELGDMTSGDSPGRLSEKELTVCDLTGTGVQDTAIALFARERLEKENAKEGAR